MLGVVTRDYPHIPSQHFFRVSGERLEVVDVRVPPRLRVAYLKGTDDLQRPLADLRVNVQVLEPVLVPVLDLSEFSTMLVGTNALANDALAGAVPALRAFMRRGGTLVVLSNGDDIARSGLLPFPIAFDTVSRTVTDPASAVRVTDARSPLLNWPNVIGLNDFKDWSGERARSVPAGFDARYGTVLSTADAGQPPTAATILVAPVGRGIIVYTALSFDRQLAAVNAGAARLLVNLLATGLHAEPKRIP